VLGGESGRGYSAGQMDADLSFNIPERSPLVLRVSYERRGVKDLGALTNLVPIELRYIL
jgi:hypothetical protein